MKALGAAELQRLALAKGDVSGYEVAALKPVAPARSRVTAAKEKCRPVLALDRGGFR
ncbi:hypothetical protein [Streptomyces sp. NPDC006739]|uniref:hypothetical protein n=1 Tax=Streptomyces sp. NPDC006739 TaxID=3364763 RepID=UPI0036B29E43